MSTGWFYGFAIMAMLLTSQWSCSIDTNQDGQIRKPTRKTNSECPGPATQGCIIGKIISAPDITIAGESFLDASEFAKNFHVALAAIDFDGLNNDQPGKGLALKTKLENQHFAKDFTAFVKSYEFAKQAPVRSRGEFRLDGLPNDVYEVRLQKSVVFTLDKEREAADPDAEEANDEEQQAETQTVCALIYQEETVEVVAGKALNFVFEDFELKILGENCER